MAQIARVEVQYVTEDGSTRRITLEDMRRHDLAVLKGTYARLAIYTRMWTSPEIAIDVRPSRVWPGRLATVAGLAISAQAA